MRTRICLTLFCMVLKDTEGKAHEFFPLILTEPKKAASFLINDYSGK